VIKKKSLSKKDLETWNKYIKNPTDLVDKDNIHKKKESKPIRFRYDLHGFSLLDANKKIEELIIYCVNKNYKEILLITGKGLHSQNDKDIYVSKNLGTLRYSVPEFIKSDEELNNLIVSINEAEIKDGGAGAILIKLKNL